MDYQKLADELGWRAEDIKRGYIVVYDEEFGVDLIQKLDDLEFVGIAKFKSDTEAGEQAAKDGFKLLTVDHEDLAGWYILDTAENRKALMENGYLVEKKNESIYQIQYDIHHEDWVENVKTNWIRDEEFLKGMLKHLRSSNAINIKVVKQVDVTDEFI